MEISSHLLSDLKISLQFSDDLSSQTNFFENEILHGKVLKITSSNDALLLINGTKVTAKTQLPLKEGAMLLLKVEKSTPVPTLKVLTTPVGGHNTVNTAVILAAMQENLWQSILENMLSEGTLKENELLFRDLMTDLSSKLFKNADPDILKTLINKSGLNWEKKLKDICLLKQSSTDAVNKLVAEDLKGMGSRLLSLNTKNEILLGRLISTLNNLQLLNLLGLEQDRTIFLPIPMQFPNGLFTVGQLLIHLHPEQNNEHEKKKAAPAFYRLSFLLELSNIGPLRVDLTVRDKMIDGRFLFSKKESKLLIEKHLPSLVDNLQQKGFSIRHMECHVTKSEIVQQSLIREIMGSESSLSLMA